MYKYEKVEHYTRGITQDFHTSSIIGRKYCLNSPTTSGLLLKVWVMRPTKVLGNMGG